VTTDDAGRAYVVGDASTFIESSRTGVYRDDGATGSVTLALEAAPASGVAGGVAVSAADQYHRPHFIGDPGFIAVAVPEPAAGIRLPLPGAALLSRRR